MKHRIRVHLSAHGDHATLRVADDDVRTYREQGGLAELPLTIPFAHDEDLTRRASIPPERRDELLSLLGLSPNEGELDVAADIELTLRDDDTTVEYIAPGSARKVAGTRAEIVGRLASDFGVELDLSVLTLDSPKLRRSFAVDPWPTQTG